MGEKQRLFGRGEFTHTGIGKLWGARAGVVVGSAAQLGRHLVDSKLEDDGSGRSSSGDGGEVGEG